MWEVLWQISILAFAPVGIVVSRGIATRRAVAQKLHAYVPLVAKHIQAHLHIFALVFPTSQCLMVPPCGWGSMSTWILQAASCSLQQQPMVICPMRSEQFDQSCAYEQHSIIASHLMMLCLGGISTILYWFSALPTDHWLQLLVTWLQFCDSSLLLLTGLGKVWLPVSQQHALFERWQCLFFFGGGLKRYIYIYNII